MFGRPISLLGKRASLRPQQHRHRQQRQRQRRHKRGGERQAWRPALTATAGAAAVAAPDPRPWPARAPAADERTSERPRKRPRYRRSRACSISCLLDTERAPSPASLSREGASEVPWPHLGGWGDLSLLLKNSLLFVYRLLRLCAFYIFPKCLPLRRPSRQSLH